MRPPLNKIYVVIPSFNEGERIARVVRLVRLKGFTNIIVVDDGSTDGSIESLKTEKVIILEHLVNRGAGAATETGLKYCRELTDATDVVMIDADAQHDAEDISKLLDAHFEQQADITIGNRFIASNNVIPFRNKFYNHIANIITTMFSGLRVRDSQSGFKVFSRKALDTIIIEQERFEHCSEIFIKAFENKLRIIDVPVKVSYSSDVRGKGQNLFNGVRTFINLLHSELFKNKET